MMQGMASLSLNTVTVVVVIIFGISCHTTNGQIWERMPRLCEQISVRDTSIWCVTQSKQLWKWVYGIHDWIWVEADTLKVLNVAVGFDESIWAVTENGEVWSWLIGGKWTNRTNSPSEQTNGTAVAMKQVSALDADEALGVSVNDTIFHFYNGTWTKLAGEAVWISVGRNGEVYSVTRQGEVQRMNDNDWTKLPLADFGDQIKYIDVYDETRIVATDMNRRIQLWLNAGERYLEMGKDDRGPKWKMLVTQPQPNCLQASLTKTNIYCVSDNQFINKASSW